MSKPETKCFRFMDQMTTLMCSLHYQWEKKRFTYLLTASSVRASPVLWRPITTHFPSSRACFASRTAAGTLADMHMCRKKRWHHQFHNVTIQKWLDIRFHNKRLCKTIMQSVLYRKPIEETLVCMANRNWGEQFGTTFQETTYIPEFVSLQTRFLQ